jgi:hypothetical protein
MNRIFHSILTRILSTTLIVAIGGAVYAELVAVPAPAAAVPGAVPGIEQQLRAQLEPMLKVELSFANRACKFTDDQRRRVITNSNDWLTTFCNVYAKQGGQQFIQGGWIGGGQRPVSEPRASIEKNVARIVKAEVPREQADLYAAECKKRSEFSLQTSIDLLVTRIDHELILSPEQREKISQSLAENWNQSWAPQIEVFMHGMDVWPNVPDRFIRPHLSATQQVAWSKLNKHSGNVFFGGMGNEGQVIDDIDLKEGQPEGAEDKNAAKDAKPAAAILVAPRAAN